MACTAPLRSLLAVLHAAPWACDAVAELEGAGHAALSGQLRAALAVQADAASCDAVVDALWKRAEEGVGWTEPFWRECYVLACVAAAVVLAGDSPDSAGGHQAALRHLDMAYIMGGPPEVLDPFVHVVEPLVPRRAAACHDAAELLPRTLPQSAAPVLREGCSLHRLDAAGWGSFRKEFYNLDKPVVLAGLADAWPALDKWRDLGWWETQFGHRCVPLEVGTHRDGTWHEKVVPLCELVAALRGDSDIVYLAQHPLFEQLPALRDDYRVPDCVGSRLTRTNAWLGSRNTVTPLHFDSYDGLLTQVCGYKYVRLYAPSQGAFLYRSTAPWESQRRWPTAETEPAAPDGAVPQGTISLVDVEKPDLERFPLFAQASFVETVLAPGDALFIPADCWHFVKSLSVSASISFVF